MSATIVLNAREFASLMQPVLPFVEKPGGVPILTAIRVRSHGAFVSAIATDRYRAGWRRVTPVEAPDLGFDTLLPARVAARLLRDFRERRGYPAPMLRLTSDGTALVVEAADYALDMVNATMRFETVAGDYPPVEKLIFEAAGRPAAGGVQSVNLHFLADFQIDGEGPVVFSVPADNKPWFVRVGEDFIGAIVPLGRAGQTIEMGDVTGWPTVEALKAATEKAVA